MHPVGAWLGSMLIVNDNGWTTIMQSSVRKVLIKAVADSLITTNHTKVTPNPVVKLLNKSVRFTVQLTLI